jgi:hypothetical protein
MKNQSPINIDIDVAKLSLDAYTMNLINSILLKTIRMEIFQRNLDKMLIVSKSCVLDRYV